MDQVEANSQNYAYEHLDRSLLRIDTVLKCLQILVLETTGYIRSMP